MRPICHKSMSELSQSCKIQKEPFSGSFEAYFTVSFAFLLVTLPFEFLTMQRYR